MRAGHTTPVTARPTTTPGNAAVGAPRCHLERVTPTPEADGLPTTATCDDLERIHREHPDDVKILDRWDHP